MLRAFAGLKLQGAQFDWVGCKQNAVCAVFGTGFGRPRFQSIHDILCCFATAWNNVFSVCDVCLFDSLSFARVSRAALHLSMFQYLILSLVILHVRVYYLPYEAAQFSF